MPVNPEVVGGGLDDGGGGIDPVTPPPPYDPGPVTADIAALEAAVAALTSGKQDGDATLTALAVLADTAFGRALIELANAAALRAVAGLAASDSPTFAGLAGGVITGTRLTILGTGASLYIDHAGGGTSYYDATTHVISNADESVEFGRFTSAGFAPLSTTTASAGNVYQASSGSVLLRSTSSLRYKQDIRPVTEGQADAVLLLRPVRYRSKGEYDNPEWSWYGLIAEEVAQIDPRLVHWCYWPEDYDQRFKENKPLRVGAKLRPDGVQYERLVVLLLDVVRRLVDRVAALEVVTPQLKVKGK